MTLEFMDFRPVESRQFDSSAREVEFVRGSFRMRSNLLNSKAKYHLRTDFPLC